MSEIADDVGRISLRRRHAADLRAVQDLIRYVRRHSIQLLHAHSSSLFLAVTVSLFRPFPRLIWHDHFGRYETESRRPWMYRLAIMRVGGVIAVNEPLATWSRERLKMPADRVWCVPNFVNEPDAHPQRVAATLPGTPGNRIICVANLRRQKDHVTLLNAMRLVIDQVPEARLYLVGASVDPECERQMKRQIEDDQLKENVSWLGERNDVYSLLQACDVAVLSSMSEGSPLALMEYGMVGLPTVATAVGQCPEILDHGKAGILVSPRSPGELAGGILRFLKSSEARMTFGDRFRNRVQSHHHASGSINRICRVYDTVLRQEMRTGTT